MRSWRRATARSPRCWWRRASRSRRASSSSSSRRRPGSRRPMDPASPYYTEQHEAFRDTIRRFVAKEIEPFAAVWDEAETFPRELYEKAAAVGLLALGFPEAYGGVETDSFYGIIAAQELAKAGAGGIAASLQSHTIGAPPIAIAGSEELKRRLLPEILAGRKISALAITEPSG